MDSIKIAQCVAKSLSDKKGTDIKILDISALTTISDYFVICSAGSTTQVKALADNVLEKTGEIGISPLRIEGYKSCSWILLDYGDAIVHIFKNDMRDFYNLEHLWGDAVTVTENFDL